MQYPLSNNSTFDIYMYVVTQYLYYFLTMSIFYAMKQ